MINPLGIFLGASPDVVVLCATHLNKVCASVGERWMDVDKLIDKSKYGSQSRRGAVESQFHLLYHPLLMPNNYWVWRFIPGVVVGVVLGALYKPKRRRKKEFDEVDGDAIAPVSADDEVKLVMIVNKGLKTMKPGKIAAQCGHAAALVVKKLLTQGNARLFKLWEDCGQPKVVVKAQSREQMEALGDQAHSAGIMVSPVLDAGRTQVTAGSMTVMAIGPAEAVRVDSITGHLPLM